MSAGLEFSLVQLLSVLFVAWLAGALANRIGYPSVLGELAAGIVFGPTLLGLLGPSPVLAVLAEIGVFLMMLYIGMEVDHRELTRASRAGLLAAVGGFLTPFALGYFVTVGFGEPPRTALFVAIAVGVTSLATKSRILLDLRLLGTRVANVLLVGALVSDTAALVVFAGVMGVAGVGSGDVVSELGLVGLKAVLFFGAALFGGLKVIPWLGKMLERAGFTERTTNFTLVLLVALLFGEMAELAGLHSILGGFIAGLFLRQEVRRRRVSHEITQLVHDLSIGFLAPIFFITAGFQVSLDVFQTDLLFMVAVIGLATVGKIVGAVLFYLPSGHGWREGLAVGVGMNGRGAVEIIIAEIGVVSGIISREIFSILVFMAFFTTATVPFLLKWTTEWLRKRGELARSAAKRPGALIIGAGPVARHLARTLAVTRPVSLIDSDPENCEAARHEGLYALRGDALDEHFLNSIDAASTGTVIACTSSPKTNVLAARLLHMTFGAPDVQILLGPGDRRVYEKFLDGMDARVFDLGSFDLSVWNELVSRGRASPHELEVETETSPEDFLEAAHERTAFLPLVVTRESQQRFFHAMEVLLPKDWVLGLSLGSPDIDVLGVLERTVRQAAVIEAQEPADAQQCLQRVAEELAQAVRMEVAPLRELLASKEEVLARRLARGVSFMFVEVPGEDSLHLACVRAPEGVALSEKREAAIAVLVFAGTADRRGMYLRFLSLMSPSASAPEFKKRWLEAPDADALRRTLEETFREAALIDAR